jgi:hypothetical protein
VIVDDFNILSVRGLPYETDPPLIIDPNTVLPGTIAIENFQPVTWHTPDFLQAGRSVKDAQLATGNPIESLELF